MLRKILVSTILLVVTACSTLTPDRSPPKESADLPPALRGFSDFRIWGDAAPPGVEFLRKRRMDEMRDVWRRRGSPRSGLHIHMLALSGGGPDGAYGAGVLRGWTEAGTRPEFDVVTGISTGALIAPFAFLGPDYDDELKKAYTTLNQDSIAVPQIMSALMGALSLADTSPLKRSIATFLTDDMIEKIGEEHTKGRRLLVGTTNLDAQRPVIWDVGRIAASGEKGSHDLVRKVILASASIPGAFPPVLFDVEEGGETHQEMHVDGGVTTSVFLFPIEINAEVGRSLGFPVKRDVYILMNNKIVPRYDAVRESLPAIVGSSISTLIRNQGRGDIYRIYLQTQRDGLGFHLGFIPASFDPAEPAGFDPAYMTALYDLGAESARNGYPWLTAPPGLGPKTTVEDAVKAVARPQDVKADPCVPKTLAAAVLAQARAQGREDELRGALGTPFMRDQVRSRVMEKSGCAAGVVDAALDTLGSS